MEGAAEVWPDGETGAGVVEGAAVVGRTKHRHNPAPCLELVAVLDHLMAPADKVDVKLGLWGRI